MRGVSFDVHKGETLAIVGESGSGKSDTAKGIMKLLPKGSTMIKSGTVLYQGNDLLTYNQKQIEKIREKEIAMIFQDPMTYLNPTMKVGKQLVECISKHLHKNKKAAYKRAEESLVMVGIPHPKDRLKAFPHQSSGGLRQRVVIAIALSSNPKVIIA